MCSKYRHYSIFNIPYDCIRLFRFITMLCGTDNIPQNIPHIQPEYGEYTVSPTKHCYGSE